MERPNFLVFVTDQHCADHLGCYGNEVVRTPNIDRLAARGVVFDKFYVASPICMPNRAAMMTGRYPSLNGVRHNGIPLSVDELTFADVLSAVGYDTALVGKSHLQNISEYPPAIVSEESRFAPGCEEPTRSRFSGSEYQQESPARWTDPAHKVSLPYYGFQQVRLAIDHGDLAEGDYYRWFKQQRADADQLRGPSNAFSDLRHEIPQGWLTRVPEELYPSSYVRHFAEAFLEERAKAVDSRPFLLKCSFPDPHHPFTPPGRYAKMYSPQEVPLPITCGPAPVNAPQHLAWLHEQRRSGRANPNGHLAIAVSEAEARGAIALTYGMITMIDDMVGRIVDKLRQTGFFENTVVIFTSDHGDFMGNHGLILKAPLHYQSLIRVPFIWSDPMQQTLPARTRVMASTVDIAKTILERAGLSGYSGIQGNDLVEKLSRDVDENDGVLIEEDSQRVLFGFIAPPRLRTIVTARWRLSIYLGVAWGELYDLDCDPDELCNLWEDPACTEIRARLTEQLLRLMMSACDRSPLPLRLA